MKNILNKLLLIVGLAFFVGACEKDDDFEILNPDAALTATITKTEVILSKDDLGLEALSVKWTAPEFGYSAAPIYRILIDLTGNDFSNAYTVNVGNNLDKTFKTEELNKILLKLGVKAKDITSLDIKVQSVLSQTTIISSSVLKLNATAYTDILDLSTPWSVVGSAITGDDSGWNMDLPLFTTNIPDVFVAYVTLFDGKYKIRKDKDWAESYGLNGNDIEITAGFYKITFNFNTKAITSEAFSWGIVGDATPIGWPAPGKPADEKFTYDQYSDTWKVIIALKDGNIKFRQNNDWGVNYGYSGVPGILGGDDIPVTAGNYIVTIDFNKLEYSLEKIDHIWGIVGDATPIGWPATGKPADAKLTIDFSTSDEVWVIRNFKLKDGKIKFRADNDWGVNYGYSGVAGILGGDDIPVTEGTYNIFLNISQLTYELVKL